MCGRYDLNESPQMLALHFLLSAEPAVFSNADVRPTVIDRHYGATDDRRNGASLKR